MPKLRYKDDGKKKEKRHHSSRRKEKPYKPPTLYEEEEGWVPPSHSHKDQDAAWREHLFDAMMDDEGQDPFYSRYEQSSQPTPMTDEEYRQHIVNGMYKRTHADEIVAEEKRKAHKEKKRREKEEQKAKMAAEDAERIRTQNVYRQLEDLKKRESSKSDYVDKWTQLETLDTDIPWPVVGKVFSFDTVKLFIMDSKLTPAQNKKNVRKEQLRYHPDKFVTKYMKKFHGSEKEKERVMTRINEISGWLNQLWTQVNE
ncbi:unnamed protein product [Mucor hiemalis]